MSAPLAEVVGVAAAAIERFHAGQSLDRSIAAALGSRAALRPAVLDVAYTTVRHHALTEHLIARLAQRPPAPRLRALVAVSLAQLIRARHGDHTVVDQAVGAARAEPATAAAAGFVNALLRNFLRQRDPLLDFARRDDVVRFNAPRWWIDRLRSAYPDRWQTILAAQSELPPLVLRVARRVTVDAYTARCEAAGLTATRVGVRAVAITPPRPVAELPGFSDGDVSVQDAGAQLAAAWLDVQPGARVLDACAAPGGKTLQLAEIDGSVVAALDVDAARVERIRDNLARAKLAANILVGDATDPARWWDGAPYDRILLDAPCTASGIVRRHPDIPWVRRPDDVAQLTTQQARLLAALWPLLGVGGRLLYVVCSLFPEEGPEQIARFAGAHPEAREVPLPAGSPSLQLTPTPAAAPAWDGASALPTVHDGFFFALLEKTR
jgi:16S rRNA (cytosine967-C5)-methyltransferase